MSDGADTNKVQDVTPAPADAPSTPAPAKAPSISAAQATDSFTISQAAPTPTAPASFGRPAARTFNKPQPQTVTKGGWWTLPMLTVGIGTIAAALIVGQVEDNRQLAWQANILRMNLEHLQKQEAANREFVERLGTDANLAERLAQRQMKMVREGAAVLDVKGLAPDDSTSAFKLTKMPPLPQIEPYQPASGPLSRLFSNPHRRVWAYGIGAMLIAMGLLGGGPKKIERR